jgi:hypothetical protein
MKIPYNTIEDAFFFVASDQRGMHSALLDKTTGRTYFRSEMCGLDEIPEEIWGLDSSVEIPHKNDLDLGRDLVFEFAESRMPNDCNRVQDMFRKRGAYSRFKDLLQSKGLLQEWYDFENESQKQAILEWCKDNGVEVE